MGLEATCTARFGRKRSEGKALLETEELVFVGTPRSRVPGRGEFRLKIPLKEVTAAEAAEGTLRVTFPDGEAFFDLGARVAATWAQRIRNPRGLLDKLEVKPGSRIAVLGLDDAGFLAQLKERAMEISRGELLPGTDRVFLRPKGEAGLGDRLKGLLGSIKPNGAIWVLWPKGQGDDAGYAKIKAAAEPLGLVDTKYVAFSKDLGALKLMIRKSSRPAPRAVVEVPPELRRAIDASPKAKAAFDGMPPSHQKEYVGHVMEAKREATREKRIAQTVAMLEAAAASARPRRGKP